MILLTGATGFLGAELALQLLKANSQLRCIKREDAVIPEKLIPYAHQIEWVIADILDLSDLEDTFEGVTHVYHCAALVSFESRLKKQMLLVNAEGTANVVNLCLQFGVKKLVYVSSIAALGDAKENNLIDENCFWEGFETHEGYAVSKYRGEMEVWRGINEGLNAIIVNPSIIIGADAGKDGSGAIFHTIKNGINYYPQGASGFVDVKDVAACMILLMQGTAINQRFLINAQNLSYKELFEITTKELGEPSPTKLAKPWMLAITWRLNTLKNKLTQSKGGFNKTLANTASKISRYSNKKIINQLNYQFKPIEITITEIVNSLKSA